MNRICAILFLAVFLLLPTGTSRAWVIDNWWDDGDDIVMDDVLLPADPWSAPAQFQMSEYNEIDTTDNSHPFRISLSPQFSFGANDGDNTIGFLDEAGLSAEYGLSYADALAWTVCWSSGRLVECDVMLDPTLPWSLAPDDSEWFQSTVLHELGHVRGLDHYNAYQSMQNSGQSKYLRNEILYMDDKDGLRQHASFVAETDMVMYNKWHDGTAPQWMTMSPTTLREYETVQLSGITVENRGSQALGSQLNVGFYLSDNVDISPLDRLLNTGYWDSFGTFTYSTFDWSATIPTVDDCGSMYLGGIIDHDSLWAERFEGNNSVTFTNGVAFTGTDYTPTPLSILLARDAYEPNDSFGAAAPIGLNFNAADLSIDTDLQQDFYGFTLTCGMRLDAGLGFLNARGDIDLDLRTSGNSVIASSASTGNGESIVQDLPAGSYVLQAYGFGAGSCNKYSMTVTATDVTAPSGSITSPADGACSGAPVTIEDDFTDECDATLDRTYSPGPGPTYSSHGDHSVTLTVEDDSGNQASDSVSFTIDLLAPTVSLISPPFGALLLPTTIPLGIVFSANDNDGAAGGVVREVILFAGCPVLDGMTYGDGDGLLSDEAVTLSKATLCATARACGLTQVTQPVLEVRATDCGGNTGSDAHQFQGSLKLFPGICGI